jgi:putative tricarboxylic transport membrane protein
MVALGLLLGTVGLDPIMGSPRFTYGVFKLSEGFEFVLVAMGLFGIGEVLANVEQSSAAEVFRTRIRGLLPSRAEWRQAAAPVARGSLLGFFIGVLPGGGATISSFVSYAMEKRLSRQPEQFGQGAVEGVAGPEAANNAAATSSFIPLLTLGIPGNASIAMIFAALMIHGVRPGPLLLTDKPDIFWGLVASMYLGNVMLLVLNLPLIGLWVKMLQVPYPLLAPFVVVFVIVGAYSVNNSIFDVGTTVVFGLFGYLLRKLAFEPAPLVLAMILGPAPDRGHAAGAGRADAAHAAPAPRADAEVLADRGARVQAGVTPAPPGRDPTTISTGGARMRVGSADVTGTSPGWRTASSHPPRTSPARASRSCRCWRPAWPCRRRREPPACPA